MFCFVFQNSHFTLALVLSVLISQTGLFQYERWVADHRTKEGVDQDVALCCGTVVIPTGKHICQCKSECVYPQSNSQFSAWMTLCCLHPHARQAASYPEFFPLNHRQLQKLPYAFTRCAFIHKWLHFSVWADITRVCNLLQMRRIIFI